MTSAHPPRASTANPGRWKLVVGALGLAALLFVVWQFPSWQRQAEVGAAYGARIGCSCHFVQGRSLNSCATDFEPGMELVSIAPVDGERAITASVPLLASRTARHAGATGCVLDPE